MRVCPLPRTRVVCSYTIRDTGNNSCPNHKRQGPKAPHNTLLISFITSHLYIKIGLIKPVRSNAIRRSKTPYPPNTIIYTSYPAHYSLSTSRPSKHPHLSRAQSAPRGTSPMPSRPWTISVNPTTSMVSTSHLVCIQGNQTQEINSH